MKTRTIIFDFDGVLCFDHFYALTLSSKHSNIADWIKKNIFENDPELVQKWMKGKINSSQVNKYISQQTGTDYQLLQKAFIKSVELMKLDQRLLSFITQLRNKGIRIGLVTDNMDVFTTITVNNHHLSEKFDVIVNSADYGILKKDQNGKLFDIALSKLGEDDISKSLMVDNQAEAIELYKKKGGKGYLYKSFEEFENWIRHE